MLPSPSPARVRSCRTEPHVLSSRGVSADPRDQFFDTRHLDDEVEREAVRGGRIVAIAQVPRALIQVGSTIALAHMLTPRDSVLVVVMGLLAPALAWFYGEPQLMGICFVLSASMLLGGVANQHVAVLKRQMRFGALKLVELGALVIAVGAAIGAAWAGAESWALVVHTVVSGAVTAIGSWWITGWRPSRPQRVEGLGELIKFGANLTGFTFVNYFARNLDDVLIGRFAGDSPAARAHNLGGYQKAYELLMLPLKQLSSPISAVALPTLSRLQDQPERYRQTYLRALRLLVVVTMPLVAYLIVMAREIIVVVLGPQWVHAAEIFQVLGLAAFTQPLANSSGWLFISQDRTAEMLRWGFFGAGTATIAFVAGLPWGAFGVAAAYAGSSVFIRTPALLWYIGRKGPVRTLDLYAAAGPFLVSGLVTGGALVGLRHLFPIASPLVALVAYAVPAMVVSVLALLPFASGRSTLNDAKLVLTRRLAGKSVKETARDTLEQSATEDDQIG